MLCLEEVVTESRIIAEDSANRLEDSDHVFIVVFVG
nr:MAG: hypothetical protein [Microviridae sp.]